MLKYRFSFCILLFEVTDECNVKQKQKVVFRELI